MPRAKTEPKKRGSRFPLTRIPCQYGPLGDHKDRKTKRHSLKVSMPWPSRVEFPRSGGFYELDESDPDKPLYVWRDGGTT